MNAVAAGSSLTRWLLTPIAGLIITALLFLALCYIIRGPQHQVFERPTIVENVRLAKVEPDTEEAPDPIKVLENSPPPPPSAPPALGRPDLPALEIPSIAIEPVEVSNISVPIALGASGLSLGSTGRFSGFGSGGTGNGAGTGGSGTGGGWDGKPLVPLSTARPQMPQWACDKKLNGWVEAIFTVMPSGRVQQVRIVDAQPRGVFEAAAIESISNWIYAQTKKAAEVKQRVEMNYEDCAYNW